MRTLLAAVIVLLALAGFLGLVAERAQVPDAVRQGILAAVSEGLGRRVSLGAVRGSPWRGVVLEDVLITEPDGQTPFVRARRVTVRMNPAQLITDLLTGRGPLASINAIDLEDAYLRVARDGRGRWNYADLVARQRPPDPSAPGLRARLTFSRGTVLYYDALQLPTPFHVVMSRVEGSLDMRRSPRVAVDFSGADEGGGRRVQARVRGSYLLRAGTFSLDVDVARVDLRHWASYLLRLPRLDWQAGTVDGRLQLTSERWRNRNVLDYRGTLMLRDGQALLLPQRALLAGVNGPMEVDNLRVASAGLRGSLQGAPLAVRGEIRRTPDPLLDLVVKSSNLDLATLKFLFFPRAGLTLSGRASGEVRVAGILSIPRVEGSITAAQSTLNRQPVEAFSGTVGYDGRHLTFADVTARLPGGSALAGHVLIDLQRPGFLAQAHATSMDLDSPLRLGLPVLLPARGPATGGFVAAGHQGRVIALAGLRMGAGASFRTVLPIEDAEGVIWYDSGAITVDALALRRGATGVYLSGQIGAGGALNLSVVGERVALAEVDTYLRLGGLLHGEADVRGGIVGTMDAPRLVGHVAARAGRLGPLTFDLLRGEVEFGAQGIGARGVTVVDGATFLRMDGTAEWGAGGALDLTVRADNLPVSRLSQYARVTIPVEGDIAGRLHLGGRIDDPRVAGEVSLSRARVLGQRVDQVTARFRYTGDRLTVDEAVARVNSSTVRASGTLDAQTLTLDFSAQAFRLEDLRLLTEGPLVARGPVDLTGQIRGTPLRPDVRGRVTAGPITLNGQTFTGVEGQVQWRDGLLVLDPLNLERNRERYHLAGRLERTPGGDGTQRVTLSATVEDGRLSTLVGLTRTDLPVKMEGLVRGALTLQGPIESPTGRLDLRVTDGTLGTLPVSDARLNVGWQGQAFTIDTLEVRAGRGLLAAKGRLDMRGETLIEVSGTDLDVEVLQSLLRGAPRMAGTANFTAQLTGRSADPQLGLSLEVRNGSVRDTGFDSLIAQAFHQRGVLTIEQAMLVRGEHRVRVDGQIPIDLFTMRFHERQPLALRANLVDADLSMLRLFTDRVAEARGRVEGQVTVSGTVANPHMAGLLRASGGFLRLTGISPAFEEVQGEIVFTENRADVRGVSARIGGGAVRVAGQTTVSEFRPDRLDIRVDVERASVAVPPYFSGRVDASAQLVGTARQPVLRGAVTLSRGDLRVASLGEAGKAVTAGSPAGRQPSLALDLRVQAGQELWVNLGQLRVEIDGSLHVGGTPSRPLLAGQIQTHEGRFSYLGGLFILEEGSATFAEFRGLIPYVTARAQTTVGNARIRIEAEGTPDDLNVQLSSEPVMSRQEIVTLLARQAGYEYLLRGDIEGAVRAELSRLLFGRFEQAVIRSFGLSEFRLSYDFARPLELRIGKYLLRNLYVTFATTFGPNPANLWSLEYRFTPSTALGLTLDHLGRYGILLSHVIRY